MIVKVSQNYIDEGSPMCEHNCAIAMAVRRSAYRVCYVNPQNIRIYEKGSDISFNYEPDNNLRLWINDFDNEEAVEPISILFKDGKAVIYNEKS